VVIGRYAATLEREFGTENALKILKRGLKDKVKLAINLAINDATPK
jgi:hypothetical protein